MTKVVDDPREELCNRGKAAVSLYRALEALRTAGESRDVNGTVRCGKGLWAGDSGTASFRGRTQGGWSNGRTAPNTTRGWYSRWSIEALPSEDRHEDDLDGLEQSRSASRVRAMTGSQTA